MWGRQGASPTGGAQLCSEGLRDRGGRDMSLPERGRLHHECIGAVSCLSSEHPLGPLALPGTSRLCLPSGVSWGESKPRVRPEPQTPGSGSRRAASTARSGPAAHWNPAPNHFWAASRRLRSTRAASSQRGQPRKRPWVPVFCLLVPVVRAHLQQARCQGCRTSGAAVPGASLHAGLGPGWPLGRTLQQPLGHMGRLC